MTTDQPDLAEDLLTGAEAIAEFLGWPTRRVYHYAEKGAIPVFQLPPIKTLHARKSQLRAAFTA